MEESSTDELKHSLVRGWLIKAQHDLATASKLAAGPDPYLDTAIYHCQQAAEKSVKGFLAFHDQRVVRTHDVRYLLTLAIAFDKSLSASLESAERVTPYATAFRYPDEVLEPELEEFEQALAAAEEICTSVLAALPERVHPGGMKTDRLRVPAGLIEREGAVSRPVAQAMAEGARERSGADEHTVRRCLQRRACSKPVRRRAVDRSAGAHPRRQSRGHLRQLPWR